VLSENARTKLASKQGDLSKLTKKDISAIFLAFYQMNAEESKYARPNLIQILVENIAESPENIIVAPVSAAASGLSTAAVEAPPKHIDSTAVATVEATTLRSN
jgi:hypothetical protein